ncbi:MAG: hypothetical protein ABI222_12700 [Opitutaceae bacterium]
MPSPLSPLPARLAVGHGVMDATHDTTELRDELVIKGFTRGRDVV